MEYNNEEDNILNPEDITLEEILKQITSYELLIAKNANGKKRSDNLYEEIDKFDANSYSYIRYLVCTLKSICNEINRNISLTKNLKFTKENFEFMRNSMIFFCELDDYKTITNYDDNKVSEMVNDSYLEFEKRYNETIRENLIMYGISFTDSSDRGLEVETDEKTMAMIAEKTTLQVIEEMFKENDKDIEYPEKDYKLEQRIKDVKRNEM